MRYRKLDSNGDYSFGHGQNDFFINNAAAVAQAIKTRLLLMTGEWFLDQTEGTPYSTQITGTNTSATRDIAVRARILETPNVLSLKTFSSNYNPATRLYSVSATVITAFGSTTVSTYL